MAMVFKCDRCGEIYNYTPPDVNGNRKSNAVIFIDNTPSGEQWRCDDQVGAIQLCPSCMKQLNDWLTPDEQKPDAGNKNKWNSIVAVRNPKLSLIPKAFIRKSLLS